MTIEKDKEEAEIMIKKMSKQMKRGSEIIQRKDVITMRKLGTLLLSAARERKPNM